MRAAAGPIGNPNVRRSKRLRSLSPERFEEPSASHVPPPKKKKTPKIGGEVRFPDVDWTSDFDDPDYVPAESSKATPVESSHDVGKKRGKEKITDDVVPTGDTSSAHKDAPDKSDEPSSDDPDLMQTLATFLAGLRRSSPDVSPVASKASESDASPSESSESDSPVAESVSDDQSPEEDSSIEISQAFSFKFYTEECLNQFNKLATRSMICERNINVAVFDRYNLTELFRRRNLFSTVSMASPFVHEVITEFYANLMIDARNMDSRKYGKVFLRNHVYEFTPVVINAVYGTEIIEDELDVDELSEVAKELTGGRLSRWPPNPSRLISSQLTSLYATLHKVAIANWVPSKNNTVVTKEQGVVIYKVGKGIPFDFGRLAFTIVTRYAATHSTVVGLPYPSLIYRVLQSQGFLKEESEKLTTAQEQLSINHNLLKGNRVKDLPLHSDTPAPAPVDVSPPVAAPSLLSPAEIQQQISLLDRQIATLQQARKTYLAMLNIHSGQKGGVESGPGEPSTARATASDEEEEEED